MASSRFTAPASDDPTSEPPAGTAARHQPQADGDSRDAVGAAVPDSGRRPPDAVAPQQPDGVLPQPPVLGILGDAGVESRSLNTEHATGDARALPTDPQSIAGGPQLAAVCAFALASALLVRRLTLRSRQYLDGS